MRRRKIKALRENKRYIISKQRNRYQQTLGIMARRGLS